MLHRFSSVITNRILRDASVVAYTTKLASWRELSGRTGDASVTARQPVKAVFTRITDSERFRLRRRGPWEPRSRADEGAALVERGTCGL